MAGKTASKKTSKKAGSPSAEYVSAEKFEALEEEVRVLNSGITDLVELIKQGKLTQPAPNPAAAAIEKEVDKAAPNKYTVNPEWEAIAKEIIGDDYVDHTEIEYLKGGGMKFTVVIKLEKSNAQRDYLERHKVDRRGREVGSEGEAGVKEWCERIRANLARPKTVF